MAMIQRMRSSGTRRSPDARVLLAASFAWVAAATTVQAAPLAVQLDEVLAHEALRGAEIGVYVMDLGNGEVLYERAPARPLILASNTKLFTTATALERLGAAHRIETVIYRRGVVDADVLHGDLIVLGGGDPSFGVRFHGDSAGPLNRFARAIRASPVRGSRCRATRARAATVPPHGPRRRRRAPHWRRTCVARSA